MGQIANEKVSMFKAEAYNKKEQLHGDQIEEAIDFLGYKLTLLRNGSHYRESL